jgi:hypothetical protein
MTFPVGRKTPIPGSLNKEGFDPRFAYPKRRISRVTKGVTWGVTCAAAPEEQLACRWLRFGLELRPPVTERLQRQALRLAILPLLQVTPLPRFMIARQNASPYRARSTTPTAIPISDLRSFETVKENRSPSSGPRQSAFPERLVGGFAAGEKEFPVPPNQFPVPPKNFPVRLRREFNQKGQSIRAVRAVLQSRQCPDSRKFPVFSLDNRESAMENSSLVTVPTASIQHIDI